MKWDGDDSILIAAAVAGVAVLVGSEQLLLSLLFLLSSYFPALPCKIFVN